MNALRILLGTLALTAAAIFPAAAGAALVPPGNSAANQYTETFPTSGGNAEAKKGKGKVSPGDVLGAGNAKKLDAQGKQGREAAAVVAATAPPSTSAADTSLQAAGGASAEEGSGGGAVAGGDAERAGSGSGASGTLAEDTSGSSGLGEVLGQATGSSSSGGTGLLLPLILLASAVWALAFFLRRRRGTA